LANTYKVLRWNLDSVRSMPAPEYEWRWDAVVGPDGVSHSFAEKSKDKGWVRSVPGRDGYWETTESFRRRVGEYFTGVELADRGQARLPINADIETRHRRCHNSSNKERNMTVRSPESKATQLDLDGHDATIAYRRELQRRQSSLEMQRVLGGYKGAPKWIRAAEDDQQIALDAIDADASPLPPGLIAYQNSV